MSVAQRYVKSSNFSVHIEEIEFDDEGNPMPSEENFRDEFVAEVQASRVSHKKGDFIHCETKEESDKLLSEIWN